MASERVVIPNLLRWLRGHTYNWHPAFSIREAILWSPSLDAWTRYSAAMKVLAGGLEEGMSFLELGSSWVGLELFLPKRVLNSSLLVQVNVLSKPFIRPVGNTVRILGTGVKLPFKDLSFDYVVAMDVLEHIRKSERPAFAKELRRVARKGVVLHMPIESEDGRFKAARFDRMHQERFRVRFGREDANTREHLSLGHPEPQELEEYFPGSKVAGTQNVEDWFGYILLARFPLTALLAGMKRFLQGTSNQAPYYSGLLSWTKMESAPPSD